MRVLNVDRKNCVGPVCQVVKLTISRQDQRKRNIQNPQSQKTQDHTVRNTKSFQSSGKQYNVIHPKRDLCKDEFSFSIFLKQVISRFHMSFVSCTVLKQRLGVQPPYSTLLNLPKIHYGNLL